MSKQNKIYQQSILYNLGLLFIVLSTSALIFWQATTHSVSFDMTRNNMRSLSAASASLLVQINAPLHITAYARQDPALREAIRQFVGHYQTLKPDILLNFVDIDASPDAVRELGIRVNGELVLEYQGRKEHVRYADERSMINAIARLTQDKQNWIAYLTGHGERDMLGPANHDLGSFGVHLKNRGYLIQPVNLAEIPDIPDNTSVLVLAGPQIPLLENEKAALVDYISRGGNFLWLLDPGDTEYLAEDLFRLLDIDIADGTVIDTASQLLGIDDPTISVITSSLYTPHPVLENFSYTTLFPHAAAILPADSAVWTSSPLLITGDQAWVETSALEAEVSFDPATDLQGPLTIGVALSRVFSSAAAYSPDTQEQRVVVIGDGDFISNTYLENSGNLELGVRIMSWLGHRDNLINVPVRTITDSQLTVPRYYIGAIGIFFLVVLPLVSLSIAATLWRKRRHID